MKKITLSFSVLALAGMFIIGCKKTLPTAPVADTETKTSVDASWALFTITDAEMIASFISENSLAPTFYLPAANSAGSVTPTQDTLGSDISFSFNQTTCLDGRYREGTVNLNRSVDPLKNPHAGQNSRYYRSVGYSESMYLLNYKVNGWKVVTVNGDGTVEGQACVVVNNLTSDSWDPTKTNLSWNIKGNFKLAKGTDSIFCIVDIVKTLLNTSDANVFAVNKKSPINWSKAKVSYSGTMKGYTSNNVPFEMAIAPGTQAILRDFTCSPDLINSVSSTGTGTVTSKSSEFHPFIDGTATFTTAKLYPRQIYFAGSEVSASPSCDNSGAVLIKGISYPIDFRTE